MPLEKFLGKSAACFKAADAYQDLIIDFDYFDEDEEDEEEDDELVSSFAADKTKRKTKRRL